MASFESPPGLGAGSLPSVTWAPSTLIPAGTFVQLPTGGWAYSRTARTTGASFDATERAAWIFVPGGHYESLTVTGNWITPTGITQGRVRCIGGGGGGGGGGSATAVTTQVGGGGGGAGSTADTEQLALTGAIAYVIGAGGTAGAASAVGGAGGNGGSGGSTTFGTIVATGGSRGNGGASNSTVVANGGAYGSPPLSTPTANIPGAGGPATSSTGSGATPFGIVTGGGGGGPATALLGGSGGTIAPAVGSNALTQSTNTATVAGGVGPNAILSGHGGAGGGGGAPTGAGGAGGTGANGTVEVWF